MICSFQCFGISFVVEVSGIGVDGQIPQIFSTFTYLNKKHSVVRNLEIVILSTVERTKNMGVLSNSDISFDILEFKEVQQIYLENFGSQYLACSPVSLSLFKENEKMVLYFLNGVFQPSFIKNSIIRFCINHLVFANGLFFHASGGIVNSNTYLMTGFSDIGKSTALELMSPDKTLSDDMIGCRLVGDRYHFYSTPFGRVVTENMHAEAKAVFFLIQSDKFRIEKINKTQAVARYMAVHQRYIISLFGDIKVKLFQTARHFFTKVNAYELYFEKDYIDKDAIDRVLNGDESQVGNDPMSEMEWQFATMSRRKSAEEEEEEEKRKKEPQMDTDGHR